MKLLLVIALFVGFVHIAAFKSGCGTAGTCSILYNEACLEDTSSELSCMQSQESCDQPIESQADVV